MIVKMYPKRHLNCLVKANSSADLSPSKNIALSKHSVCVRNSVSTLAVEGLVTPLVNRLLRMTVKGCEINTL